MGIKHTGLKELLANLRGIPDRLEQGAVAWAKALGFHAAHRVEMNAPIFTGFLRSEVQPIQPIISEYMVWTGVHDDAEYAAEVHEMVTPAGPRGLGPHSRLQPNTVEGGPGGGYVLRVFEYHISAGTWANALKRSVMASLAGMTLSPEDLLPTAGDDASYVSSSIAMREDPVQYQKSLEQGARRSMPNLKFEKS